LIWQNTLHASEAKRSDGIAHVTCAQIVDLVMIDCKWLNDRVEECSVESVIKVERDRLASLLKMMIMIVCMVGVGLAQAADGFVMKDLNGKTHRLADYKGKWVIVNYWATWCPPCQEEIPDLIALYDKRKDVVVFGVAMEYQSAKEIRSFVDDNLISYPVILGTDQLTQSIGPAEVLPTTYIYNPQGQLAKVHRGLITKAYLEKLLGSPKSANP
jgi:thiol-disulfide isomerase/thioredoxin